MTTNPISFPMLRTPLPLGPVHFIGIGGIGMSAIAEIMLKIGYCVQGSDARASANTERLQALGARIFIGHDASHVAGASAVVFSSAIFKDNPELLAAYSLRIPKVTRAEMLAELMRLQFSIAVGGTHGKTTTTSLIAAILDQGGLDPTVVNGGIINAYGTNAKVGSGKWMVVEADESDGSFLRLKSTVAVVTNIDPEHLDHYKDFDAVRQAFAGFVENIPFYGFGVLCFDHPEVQALAALIEDRRILSYGCNPQADIRATHIRTDHQAVVFDVHRKGAGGEEVILDVKLSMPGQHNILNALAAMTVAWELGVTTEAIREALAQFQGVKRRFTTTGIVNDITIIDDYGHHPVEIAAVLRAGHDMQQIKGAKVIAVVQPHRYSRLKDLFHEFCTCFNDADIVIVADVYPAGEAPIEGVNRKALVEGLHRFGHKHVLSLETPADLAALIAAEATPGDLVICLGAGDITAWARNLPSQLKFISP